MANPNMIFSWNCTKFYSFLMDHKSFHIQLLATMFLYTRLEEWFKETEALCMPNLF